MKLTELIDRILNSAPTDWHVIGHPTYRDELLPTEGDGEHWLEVRSHHSTAAHIPDASITMAWGLDENDNFQEPWANKFSDGHASSAYVDVFYNGALVFREMYVLVDGARAMLPIPDRREEPGGVPEGYARFVHLLDRIAGRQEFARYFDEAGFARMPGRPWPKL